MKKLFLCLLSSLVFIFIFSLPASSLTYYNSEGYFTFETRDFNSEHDYSYLVSFNVDPTLFSNVSIPIGYRQVAFGVYAGGYNYSILEYYYMPVSETPIVYQQGNEGSISVSNSSRSGFYIENRLYSDGTISYKTSGTFGSFSLGFNRLSVLVPFTDNNGNVFTPESLPQFELNGISSSETFHYSVTSLSSDIGSFDFYLFPSSFSESGGAVTNIISTPTYITEIPASAQYEIENDGFASFVDSLQSTYNSVTSGGLLPSIHYFAECNLTILRNRTFDPASYSLPYVKLGTLNLNNHFHQTSGGQYLDLKAIASSNSGVYAFDNLCIVAVAHKDNRDFLGRLDFSVSALRNTSVVPPNDIINSDTYSGGVVTDLQELAMYIKYLFETSDHNISVEFHNFTAYLQHIPWKNIVEEGVYYGFSDVIPRLQDIEFDTDFDLPSLMNELSPLLQNTQLSLPDLTGALAPYFNGLDITPTGNFAGFLGNMNNNFQLHLDSLFDDINHSVTDLSTELHDSVTDLSTEINNNTTEIFVPDLDDMNDRLELSGTLLSNKFKFVDDVKVNLEDVRDTIANSSESPPDWHFTVFGVRLFLVDWSVYEPYRGTVKNIFVCIAYILLFKHIYKTIPLNGGDDS